MKPTKSWRLPLSSICLVVVTGLMAATLVYGVSSTGSVSTTITAQNISVGIGDGSVAYGSVPLGSSASTTVNGGLNGGLGDTQSATNTGNITENFNIKGQNTTNWTLAATAGSEQFAHKFCNNGSCNASPTWTAMTTNYQSLATGITTSGTQSFDLQILVPTATAYFTQQAADVIVQATQ